MLYPHMLLLSWLAPGGGRGIVALDLLNCTDVQQAYSPTHPNARDDIGTVAARIQSAENDGQPLMDMLVPFHMMYADGVERLATESLLERQKWVNRILYVISTFVCARYVLTVLTVLQGGCQSPGVGVATYSFPYWLDSYHIVY